MKVSMQKILAFSVVFPDEPPKKIEDYLEGIEREELMKMGAFFLGFKNYNSKYSNPEDFMKMMFSEKNNVFFQKAYKKIEEYIDTSSFTTETLQIPYVVSSLKLFEFGFNQKAMNSEIKSEEQIQIDVFKAYLLFNEQLTDKRENLLDAVQMSLPPHKRASGTLIYLQLHVYDLTNYDLNKLFATQYLRALRFFDFLSQREDCIPLLNNFYAYFGVADYKDYLKRILPLSYGFIKSDKEAHTDIVLDVNATQNDIDFLNNLIIDHIDLIEGFDFKDLRGTPIYKIADGHYRLIYPPFAIEMLYSGLYWKLKEFYDKLPKNQKPKDLYGLKTLDFSEKFVLNGILKDYLADRYFQKTGDELDGTYAGAPDYYARNSNSILLFESKDIMISAKTKESLNFAEIQDELAEKLYRRKDGKAKAVMQLINSIVRILTLSQGFDKEYDPDKIIINPILVLHYRMFNTPGLNKFINYWFLEELFLLKKKGLNISNVKPLVIIDVDTLIFNRDVFADGILDLETCLFEYQNDYVGYDGKGRSFISKEYETQALHNSILPFSYYLEAKIDKMGLRKVPRELEEKLRQIFN
ncbi:hypothetical protein D3C85_401230 [compost metagenome]